MKTIILKLIEEVAIIEEIDPNRDLYREYVTYILRTRNFGMKYWQFAIGQCIINAGDMFNSILDNDLTAEEAHTVIIQMLGVILCVNPNVFCHEKGWDYSIESPIIWV